MIVERKTSSSTKNKLSKEFIVDKNVLSFLDGDKKFLVKILFDAAKEIKSLYGRDSKLNLKVVKDIEEGNEELFIYVRHNVANNKEALKIYFKLVDWLVKKLKDYPKLLNISPIYK